MLGLQHYTGREILIQTDPEQPLALDGELREHTPATFSIAPQALFVMAPAG